MWRKAIQAIREIFEAYFKSTLYLWIFKLKGGYYQCCVGKWFRSVLCVNDLGLNTLCEHKFHNEIKCLVSIYVHVSVNIEHEMF